MTLFFLILFHLSVRAEIFGHFVLQDNQYLFNTLENQKYIVDATTEELWFSIQSLEGRKVLVALPDQQNDQLLIASAPTISKANLEKKGILQHSSNSYYRLGDELVTFQSGKLIDNTEFDEYSRHHFIGKNVITRGQMIDGVYQIASIVEAELFSASDTLGNLVGSEEAVQLHAPFLTDKVNYVLKNLPDYSLSSTFHSFRGTIFDRKLGVKPGDPVMFLTMSGHQGDDPISANGHLAVGLGTIQPDLSIKGEIFNVYIPPLNRKEIISGSNDWVDYFGHVISGQNNYRPTYTLLLYGVDAKKLLRVRESLERYHAHFRVTEKQFSVSINCGTLTALALARENIYGIHRNGKNGSKKFPLLPEHFVKPQKMSAPKQLGYVIKTPLSEYMPRNIWDSILKNVDYLNSNENLGATRVDFIFYGQTPSARLRGGIGTNSLGDEIKAMIFGKKKLSQID